MHLQCAISFCAFTRLHRHMHMQSQCTVLFTKCVNTHCVIYRMCIDTSHIVAFAMRNFFFLMFQIQALDYPCPTICIFCAFSLVLFLHSLHCLSPRERERALLESFFHRISRFAGTCRKDVEGVCGATSSRICPVVKNVVKNVFSSTVPAEKTLRV